MGDNFLREDDAGFTFAGGVADLSGGTADQHDRFVSSLLQTAHRHHRQEMPHMKAVAGRIEAGVKIYRTFGEKLFDGFFGSVL